jgi:DNA-binding MarR family transcriptional regulator
VQSTAADTQASVDADAGLDLARDLEALFGAIMRSDEALKLVASSGLTFSQYKTLIALDAGGAGASLKDVGETMGLSLPAASRTVDGLVQLGYAERREDDVDRRMKRVAISPAGLEALARVRDLRVALIARFLERLAERDRRRLASAVTPILAQLKSTP